MSSVVPPPLHPQGFAEVPCNPWLAKIPFAADVKSRDNLRDMKLRQNQVWHLGGEFLRIVSLDRLEVNYKAMQDLTTGEGKHVTATKKEFCRLIKGAKLLTPEEELGFRTQ